ncbi:hypothetical protein ACFYPZ_24605 [Streptomyces sp. NPDC005506]|uniref:hypothetical protein n=1 Tax=Streptomyces sp. NPDC005506 TaxID=3364718 RepID=UPI00369664F7
MATTMQARLTDDTTPEPARSELIEWARANWEAHRQGDESTARVKVALQMVRSKYEGTEAFKDFTVDNAMDYLYAVYRLGNGGMGVHFDDANVCFAFKLTELVPLPERLEPDFIV